MKPSPWRKRGSYLLAHMGNQKIVTANYSFIKMEQKKGLSPLSHGGCQIRHNISFDFSFLSYLVFLTLKSKFLQTQKFLSEVGAATKWRPHTGATIVMLVCRREKETLFFLPLSNSWPISLSVCTAQSTTDPSNVDLEEVESFSFLQTRAKEGTEKGKRTVVPLESSPVTQACKCFFLKNSRICVHWWQLSSPAALLMQTQIQSRIKLFKWD